MAAMTEPTKAIDDRDDQGIVTTKAWGPTWKT
jgi:hypothetical protein